jgi:hypothetical protein
MLHVCGFPIHFVEFLLIHLGTKVFVDLMQLFLITRLENNELGGIESDHPRHTVP